MSGGEAGLQMWQEAYGTTLNGATVNRLLAMSVHERAFVLAFAEIRGTQAD